MHLIHSGWLALSVTLIGACSDSGGGGSEAVRHGVGAACSTSTDCTEMGQSCLAFKGGYCGVADCTSDASCPQGSACVAHTDGKNYCFLICVEKVDCNLNRPVLEEQANCSANVTFVSGNKGSKACVPPSSG
jgi:hypothetical protein